MRIFSEYILEFNSSHGYINMYDSQKGKICTSITCFYRTVTSKDNLLENKNKYKCTDSSQSFEKKFGECKLL